MRVRLIRMRNNHGLPILRAKRPKRPVGCAHHLVAAQRVRLVGMPGQRDVQDVLIRFAAGILNPGLFLQTRLIHCRCSHDPPGDFAIIGGEVAGLDPGNPLIGICAPLVMQQICSSAFETRPFGMNFRDHRAPPLPRSLQAAAG